MRSDASSVISSLLRASTQDHPECWNHFSLRTLKSFALQHNSRGKNTSLDPEMEIFIQQIAERNSSHLQCWWAPIPFIPVNVKGFSLKKMIAWKESDSFGSRFPLHVNYSSYQMQAMESLACNSYMQQGIFKSPKLKQVECGFSLEGSLWVISCKVLNLCHVNLHADLFFVSSSLGSVALILFWKEYVSTNVRFLLLVLNSTTLLNGIGYHGSKLFLYIQQ